MFCECNRTCNSAHRLHAQPVHMTLRLHFHLSNMVQMHHQSSSESSSRRRASISYFYDKLFN